MKAIILAAGKGTRLLPLTEDLPKVLIEINGKPYLQYVIEHLQKAGITKFAIIVGYKKEKIASFLTENNIQAMFIEQDKPLGTGHALLQAQDFVGTEDFIVNYGDNVFHPDDLKRLAEEDYNVAAAIKHDHPEKYGVIIEEKGLLKEIIEKPQKPTSNLVNPGLYKFTPDIWDKLHSLTPSPRGEIELTDAVTELAKEGKIKVLKLKKYWYDLGSPDDIPFLEKKLK